MSENNIPCRKAFTTTLLQEARKNKNIYAVTSDARGSVTLERFAEELPGQFVEVGIAEQNAVGIGAGIALCGNNVFVCGPACFYSARALEQIKVDVAYTQSNVKIIGVSGGVSYGALGATHHSLHDIAAMRTFPGMEIYLPADRFQTQKLTEYLASSERPAYVRMGRNAVPDVYAGTDDFDFRKARILAEGNDITIIAAGETVYHALQAAKTLLEQGITATVVDLVSVKPFDRETVLESIKKTKGVITVEENSIYGGIGSMVAELTAQKHPVKMKILGIPDEDVINARPFDIFRYYGLTQESICTEAKRLISE